MRKTREGLASCSFSNQSHSREWPPQGMGSLSTRISGCPLCWGPVGARGPGKKQGAEEFGVLEWKLVVVTSRACGLWPGDSVVWTSEGTLTDSELTTRGTQDAADLEEI